MPRGLMLHTKILKEGKQAAAAKLAELEAERKFYKRIPPAERLQMELTNWIKKLNVHDVVDVAAWLGLAYIIKPVLTGTRELQVKMKQAKLVNATAILRQHGILPIDIQDLFQSLFVQLTPEQRKEIERTDWQNWALALALSALIIKFGPVILELAHNSLIGLAMMFFV